MTDDLYTGKQRRFFTTLRPCPKCKTKLQTDGIGFFQCDKCGYQDYKELKALREYGDSRSRGMAPSEIKMRLETGF